MADIPDKIGKYRIVGVLGKGAMGVVYKALDERINREVAIKTIHAHLLGEEKSDEVLKRFNVEIQAVGKLSHPNIVGIYDTDEFQPDVNLDVKVPYFAMEFVKGGELGDMLDKGLRFTTDQIVNIISQVLDAFDYTHKLGIIHRDIKPANIFIDENNDAKIADFGIARFENSDLTKTGSVIGTPNYMSPEQCSGQVLDSRTDLFSIAVMLYEMLTGEKPFQGNTAHTIMLRITTSVPEKPSSINPSLPKLFDRIIAKALAKEPKARFQTAGEFREALLKVHEMTRDEFSGWQAPANKSSKNVSCADDTLMAATEMDKTLVQPAMASSDATVLLAPEKQVDHKKKKPKNNKSNKKYKIDQEALEDLNALLGSESETMAFYGDIVVAEKSSGISKSVVVSASFVLIMAMIFSAVYVFLGQSSFSIAPIISAQNEMYVPDMRVLMGDMKLPENSDEPLTDKQQSKLIKLLKVADMNMNAGRYIWPSTSNASYVYRLALQVKPDNEQAISGLIGICDVLVNQAEAMFKEQDYESVHAHIEAALTIFPGEKRLVAYQKKLRELTH